jgi:hypothetical protein
MNIITYYRVILSIFFLSTLLYNSVNAQDYVWEIDKAREREKINKIKHDSIMVHLRNKFEFSIGFGPFYQSGFYKNDVANSTFNFPNKMNQWQFALAWHPFEKWEIDIKLEYRAIKNLPDRPNLFSVINGEEISIDGEGGGMVPILFGTKYYLLKSRLRPYIGISGGICKFKTQYTEVRGNIYDGINRTDFEQDEILRIIGFETGFTYRLGERINAGIGIQYQQSEPFKEMDVGFDRISGFSITPQISVLLF